MIASESVGGIYLPPLSDELIKEGLKRSADKREAKVTQELLEKDANLISVWNNKRTHYVRTWITGANISGNKCQAIGIFFCGRCAARKRKKKDSWGGY